MGRPRGAYPIALLSHKEWGAAYPIEPTASCSTEVLSGHTGSKLRGRALVALPRSETDLPEPRMARCGSWQVGRQPVPRQAAFHPHVAQTS